MPYKGKVGYRGRKPFNIEVYAIPSTGSRCWLWQGCLDRDGYGVYSSRKAHRFVYELMRGPIPPGMQLDHTCRNHACVNPRHLEVVTSQVNMLRGMSQSAITHRTNTCQHGHTLTPDNVYTWKNKRKCRACDLERHRQRRLARRAA